MSSDGVTLWRLVACLILVQLNDLVASAKASSASTFSSEYLAAIAVSCRAQHAATLVSAKLDLSRSMRGEHFVEPEIEILVAKFIHERRQVNRASIVDARFIRHSRQRRNFDFASGECFDVQPKQMLDRVERQAGTAAVQCFITTARLE